MPDDQPEKISPYASPQSSLPSTPQPVPTDSKLPQTLGVWCIVISSLSLLMGVCCGFYAIGLAVQGNMAGPMQAAIQQAQQEAQQKLQDELDNLDEQIAKAENDEERDKLRTQRDAAANAPPVAAPDMSGMFKMFSSGSLTAFSFTEVLTGALFNTLLLAGGIGLLNRRRWAPRLTQAAAILKLARLWILYPLFVFWLLPGWIQEFVAGMVQMMESTPGQNLPPGELEKMKTVLGSVYLGMGSVAGIGMILFGTIFPAIVLWLLRKPEVQAACQGGKAPVAG